MNSQRGSVSKGDGSIKSLGEGAMTRKQRRMVLIGSALGVLAIAAALVLNAMRG